MLLRDHPLCVVISFLILTASLNVVDVRGATYLVGDSDGWTPFTNSTNWTKGKAFHVGDMLGKLSKLYFGNVASLLYYYFDLTNFFLPSDQKH